MAKISLRAYNREINNLIESGNVWEAIDHCKHIIKVFPKHIETYRLLGKAYLEDGKYDDAADILLRILSVFPDDFIAHAGMSVVMEKDNNLDAAIWHMERAYEVRSTQMIYEELRRLYIMRDGVEPPKPLITRGSLIRINIRSGLYQQAHQEIQLALNEDPQRIDLEILAARIYFMQNHMAKTKELCAQILNKLPYCYEANSMLAEIASNPLEGDTYLRRLRELDPYTNFVTSKVSIDQVDDRSVMLEQLDYEASMEMPEWGKASSLKMESTPDSDEEELPDWLNDLGIEEPDLIVVNDEFEDVEYEDEELKESTTRDTAELHLPELDESPTEVESPAQESAETAEAEIPEWMQSAGWQASEGHTAESEQEMISDFDQFVEEDETVIQSGEEDIITAQMPDWLQNAVPDEISDDQDTIEEDSEDLLWLDDILPKDETSEEMESSISEIETTTEETTSETGSLVTEAEPSPVEHGDLLESDVSDEDLVEDEIDEDFAWLESLAARQGADESTLITDPDSRTDEMPDWVKKSLDESIPEEVEKPGTSDFTHFAEDIGFVSESAQDEIAEEDEELASESFPTELAESGFFEDHEEVTTEDILPDWLSKSEEDEEEEVDRLFEEMSSLETEVGDQAELEIQPTSADGSVDESVDAITPEMVENMDEDDSLAWLESLASRQNMDEETLLEDLSTTEQPEPISNEPDEEETISFDTSAELTEPIDEEIPDWLQDFDELVTHPLSGPETLAEPSEPAGTEEQPAADERPEWLRTVPPPENIQSSFPEALSETTSEEPTAETGTFPAEPDRSEENDLSMTDELNLWLDEVDGSFDELEEDAQLEEDESTTVDIQGLLEEDEDETKIKEWLQKIPEDSESISDKGTQSDSIEPDELDDFLGKTKELTPPILSEDLVNPESSQDDVTQFIDRFFDEQEKDETTRTTDRLDLLKDTNDIPYIWEREYDENLTQSDEDSSSDRLPDWIADIPAENGHKSIDTPKRGKPEDGLEGLPDWIADIPETESQEAEPLTAKSVELLSPNSRVTESLIDEEHEIKQEPGISSQDASITGQSPQDETHPETLLPANDDSRYTEAKEHLRRSNLDAAMTQYGELIQEHLYLDEIIQDLVNDLEHYHPVNVDLWTLLGDGYRAKNDLKAALAAYTKAETLLL